MNLAEKKSSESRSGGGAHGRAAGGAGRSRIPHEEAQARGGARSRNGVGEALGAGKVFEKKGRMGRKCG
jgi:hypothetical protein